MHRIEPADHAGPRPAMEDPLLDLVTRSLEDDKGQDIVVIDLAGKTAMADHMVVASGRSGRQVSAMATHLCDRLKDAGHGTVRPEGMAQADWVLIDGGDVIVHIFQPEVRDFYNLEKMWGEALVGEGEPAAH